MTENQVPGSNDKLEYSLIRAVDELQNGMRHHGAPIIYLTPCLLFRSGPFNTCGDKIGE